MGSQKLPTEVQGNFLWLHPALVLAVQRAAQHRRRRRHRSLLSRTTCESLVHKVGHKGLRTTKEILDIATSHASGEEAVGVIFDCPKGKAKQDEDAGEGASNRPNKKNKQRREGCS